MPVKVFNSASDLDFANRPRPPNKVLPGLILDAGILGFTLDILRLNTIVYEQEQVTTDERPLSLTRIDLSTGKVSRTGTPYVQLPAVCPRSRRWRFAMVERHYNGPTLTTTHYLRCRRR